MQIETVIPILRSYQDIMMPGADLKTIMIYRLMTLLLIMNVINVNGIDLLAFVTLHKTLSIFWYRYLGSNFNDFILHKFDNSFVDILLIQ